MRNLKRALSLALASVMLLGMMVVGTSASYKDVDSKDHVEAIEVLEAVKVMVGDDKGNFNPDAIVTRAQMAVIVCKMLYGTDLDVSRFADVNTFSDVPAWAQGYVNLCASLGVVAGVGDGKFDPDASVTTAQAALMLLRALEVKVDFTAGNDWTIAAMAAAEDADLFEDMDVLASKAGVTRNNIAQMTLNALKYTGKDEVYGVELENGTVVEFDNQKDALLYTAVLDGSTYLGKIDKVDGSLLDEVFEVEVSNGTDAYGRPGTTYSHEDWDRDLTFGDKADYTYVIDEQTTIGELIDDKKLDKKVLNHSNADDTVLAAGSVVELFVDDDKNLTNVANYAYALAEITDVTKCDADDDEDAIADGAKYVIELDDAETLYDINFSNFDAKTYVKDAKLMLPVTMNGTDIDSLAAVANDFENLGDDYDLILVDDAIAASVDGKVTATADKFFRVDGTKYIESVNNDDSFALSNEGTFYLDPNNFVIGYTEKEDSVSLNDVVYVRDTFSKETTDDYGKTTKTYYAQVVKMDGTVENLVIGKDGDNDYGVITNVENLEGSLFSVKTYTAKKVIDGVNYKGCSKLTTWPENNDDYYVGTIAAGTAEAPVKLKSDDTKANATFNSSNVRLRLNNKTTYIVIKDSLADIEVTVKTGGVNTTVAQNATVIATKSSGNYVASYVILPGSEVGAASYEDVIYVDADADVEAVTVADKDCVKFDAYDEAGKKIPVTLEGDSIAEAGFYTYSVDKDGIYELEEVTDALTENDGTGVKNAKFVSYYGTLLTVEGIEDIETKDATIIDIRDTAEAGQYNKTVKTLAAMKTAIDKKDSDGNKIGYAVTLDIYADDGAVLIVVTDISVPQP